MQFVNIANNNYFSTYKRKDDIRDEQQSNNQLVTKFIDNNGSCSCSINNCINYSTNKKNEKEQWSKTEKRCCHEKEG